VPLAIIGSAPMFLTDPGPDIESDFLPGRGVRQWHSIDLMALAGAVDQPKCQSSHPFTAHPDGKGAEVQIRQLLINSDVSAPFGKVTGEPQ